MRISSLSQPQRMLATLEAGNTQIQKLQDQLATQQKQTLPSEDPLNAARTAAVTQQQAMTAQYQQNITSANDALTRQDTLLSSMSDLVLSLQDQLRSMNNSTQSTTQTAGYTAQLSSLREGIVNLLNSQDAQGHYIFAGTNNTQPPVVKVEGEYQWQGNDEAANVQVGQQQRISAGTAVSSLFSAGSDPLSLLNQIGKLTQSSNPSLADSSTLSALIQQSSDAADKVSSARASIGSRQNQLTQLSDMYTDLSAANSEILNHLQSTDTAETTLQLQSWMKTVEYSSKAYGLMNQFSLFDVI
ncbi:hypothetical protein AI29_03050 [bacteria symbiont BFo2 of Frankliniella occidentalis]|nr:hypothetical protein AI29_03050 [bacteria symbiont BFo2 of Frankliniella occidentalis]KYP93023.1 hypothetical protein WB60_03985 [bacteria symbiont BFo2 of Frankliniella occidentalis]KYP95046.1 hypothetical protein WB67_08350 [bacteria symbiont BFo2 of Frankliniella occidentalis]